MGLAEEKILWEAVLAKLFDELLFYQDEVRVNLQGQYDLTFASNKTGLEGIIELGEPSKRQLEDIDVDDLHKFTLNARLGIDLFMLHGFIPYLYQGNMLAGRKKWEIRLKDVGYLGESVEAHVLVVWPGEALKKDKNKCPKLPELKNI